MKTASTAFKTGLNKEITGLVRLWSITTKAGVPYYFTDNDEDVKLGLITYTSNEGFIASATSQEIGQGIQGLNVSFALNNESISKSAINRGDFDSATTTMLVYNKLTPTANTFTLFKGRVRDIDIDDLENAQFDIVGLVESGQSNIEVEQYSLTCRADFGDARCKFDVESTKVDFTVATSTNRQGFTSPQITQPDGHFNLGYVEILTGLNAGTIVEVQSNTLATNTVRFYLPLPANIMPGDTGKIYRGCTKSIEQCALYNNVLNFRGEPFDPTPVIIEPEPPAPATPPTTVIPKQLPIFVPPKRVTVTLVSG